ncbi:UNVERIFIED_CONTAM: hypothetical protein RMT77_015513 [Armadillidium vulgare]
MRIKTRKKPHCSFCKNHGFMEPTKQHQCKYKQRCTCILCQLTKKAQVIMCHQQRVWRHNNQKHLYKTSIKGQKCDNCRNHLIFVKKSNHDCKYKNCECNYCKLTQKRREIMKHIQRARRLGIVVDSNIQEQEDVDEDSKEKVSLDQLKSLCNDKEVDRLMEATLSKEMESLTPPSLASPTQTEVLDTNASSSSFSPTSQSVYRMNEYQTIVGKDSKESCNLSPDSTSSLGRTRERRYSDPNQSRNKTRGFDENPMSRRFHISQFTLQDQQSKHHDDDFKPILLDTPERNPLDLSTDARNFQGGNDCQSVLHSHCPRIPNNLQSSLAQFIPYPSPLDLRNYTTPHNPFLYPFFSSTSQSIYRENEYQTIVGKGSKESCNLSPDSTSSLGRTRERRYSDSYQSRNKIRGYDENPMNRKFPISPFSFQDQQSKPHDNEIKPVLFDTPERNPLDLSTDARNFVGNNDCQSPLNSHCPRIPNNLQSSLAQMIPYPSPLDLRNYTTPQNPFLYPHYLEQNSNRVAGRQPIVRPEPINPSKNNRSTLPLSPFFMRPPSETVQGTLSGQFWDSAYLPAPYPPNFLPIELYKAMRFRNPVIPNHVKVPSE